MQKTQSTWNDERARGFIKKRNRLNTVIILRKGHPKLRQAHKIRLGYPRARVRFTNIY